MKTKKIFLTIVMILVSLAIKAQDKYEFIIIQYYEEAAFLTISSESEPLKTQKTDIPYKERFANGTPFLKKIKEYQDLGWEFMHYNNVIRGINGNITDLVYIGYLRKKKIAEK